MAYYTRTGDPVFDAESYFSAGERESARRPVCCRCHKTIETARCYAWDRFDKRSILETLLCEDCKKEIERKIASLNEPELDEFMYNGFDEMIVSTPVIEEVA